MNFSFKEHKELNLQLQQWQTLVQEKHQQQGWWYNSLFLPCTLQGKVSHHHSREVSSSHLDQNRHDDVFRNWFNVELEDCWKTVMSSFSEILGIITCWNTSLMGLMGGNGLRTRIFFETQWLTKVTSHLPRAGLLWLCSDRTFSSKPMMSQYSPLLLTFDEF